MPGRSRQVVRVGASIVTSLEVIAARPISLPTSMWSAPIRHSPPVSACTRGSGGRWTRCPRSEPPASRGNGRDPGRAAKAAFPITVSPGVSTAAMTVFSVAITDASSRKMRSPRRPSSARMSYTSRASTSAPIRRRWMCGSSRRADHVAAGRRHGHAAEAREQRPGEQERRAHPPTELRVEVGLGDSGGVDADLVRAGDVTSAPMSASSSSIVSTSRMRGTLERLTGSPASTVAARIGSAPFLFPAAVTVPWRRRPPSMTKDSISWEARTLEGIAVG